MARFENRIDRNDITVDLRAHHLITDGGVNGISEVDHRSTLRKRNYVSLGGENEGFISYDAELDASAGNPAPEVFPEISYDQVEKIRGFDICFTTTAKTDEEAKELLALLGMPFANK